MLSLLLPSATKLRRLCFYTCLSFCSQGGGVCLSACWDTTPTGPGTPLGADTPWTRHPQSRHPPGADTPPGAGTLPRSRHPQEADTPWDQAHPPGPGVHPQQTATVADGTHPTGMHSCLNSFWLI